jgi:hypothetical protein
VELRDLFPEPRSAEDVLGKRIRLVIDGETYTLPVLPIRENRVWSDRLDGEIQRVFGQVDMAGDDINALFAALAAAPGRFMDMLYLYDMSGVLPPKDELEAVWTEVDLLTACLEVWRAAHPLVDIGLALMETTARQANAWRERMSSRQPSGASTLIASRLS